MNGLIPALLAVLLAEAGPRGAALTLAKGRSAIVFVVAAVLAGSAVAGGLVSPQLAPNARDLLIAVALGAGGWAQLAAVAPVTTTRAALLTFWRGGTALLVFALATRFAPIPVGLGAALGLAGAAVPGTAFGQRLPLRGLRRGCALILFGAAAIVGAIALRLV